MSILFTASRRGAVTSSIILVVYYAFVKAVAYFTTLVF